MAKKKKNAPRTPDEYADKLVHSIAETVKANNEELIPKTKEELEVYVTSFLAGGIHAFIQAIGLDTDGKVGSKLGKKTLELMWDILDRLHAEVAGKNNTLDPERN